MYHHGSHPPPGYTAYDYATSPGSSPHHYTYYAPQWDSPDVSPVSRTKTKKHTRNASFTPTKEGAGWHSPAGYPSRDFYENAADYTSPPQKTEFVSAKDVRSRLRGFSMSGGNKQSRPTRTQKQHIYVDVVDDANTSPQYIVREPEPKPVPRRRAPKPRADEYFYFNQVPTYDEQPKRTRTRRASTNTRTPPKPTRTYTAPPTKVAIKATEEDAVRAGIPSGYSIKNWDPSESPIVLLGSVFDANSLGKWIYDWTVFHHGASTPMADVAGDMWLLLIKLAGKMKRAEECVPRIRSMENREMVEDFLESGERLSLRFKKLLKGCEQFMWRAAKREGGKGVSMGKNAGCEFVESIFGRDRELENTEKLMNSIRLWNMRFDANCEDILRRPSAA